MAPRMYEPQAGKSLADIAAMMTARHAQVAGEIDPDEETPDNSGSGDGDDDAGDGQSQLTADADDAGDDAPEGEPEGEPASGQDDQEDQDDDGDTGGDTPTLAEFDVDDDTLVEIDDETQIPLGTLKQLYNSDKTIATAVEEITVAHNEASQRRTKALEDASNAHDAMLLLVQGLDQAFAVPMVRKPDAKLKTSDANAYIRQLDAWQADQQRIADTRAGVQQILDQHQQNIKTQHEAKKQQEMQILATKLPEIRNPKTRQGAAQDILDAAAYYGFSTEEVTQAVDSRLYQMAYEAQQYRKLKGMGTEQKEKLTTKIKQITTQPKVLRSKGTTAATRLTTTEKQVKVLKSKARTTGKTEDVAAYMSQRRALQRQ